MIDAITFLDHLRRCAVEGETALVVRQKPKLENGEMQYHKDGAIKCTWPASMPDKYNAKGAWYINTGSFIIDRFKDGNISASADNCEYVLFLILDDIGTKSKAPPLEPTWKMETSPGNYQWGYVFSEQPTKGDYSAAIKAIAAAGYTDSGAINPVRNVRLPGSTNIKPGKEGVASKLVEFHKEREFTLEQICEALGVTPDEADTSTFRPVHLDDDGQDEVQAWLDEQGLVLERPNSSGWMGVVCPNHVEHSDGNPMGRYQPLTRSYCCYHEHCDDWTTARFLDWVAEQGGPRVQGGLREDLLVAVMKPALDKLTVLREEKRAKGEKDLFTRASEAAEALAAVERRALDRLEMGDLHMHFCYILADNSYFNLDSRREYPRSGFDAVFRHLPTKSRHGGDKKPRCTASIFFDEGRKDAKSDVLSGVTYAPGDGTLLAREGEVFGNKWVDGRVRGKKGDIRPWMAHFESLVPNPLERNHMLNYMAYKVQHPEHKINHAMLIAGPPGVGKDTLMAPFFHAVCGPYLRNFFVADSKMFESQFGYGYESEILVINELRPDQSKDKRALENTLKPVIAAPPEYLTVNRKGVHPYQAINRLSVIAFSNFRDAIALPSDDRRWFVVWCEGKHMSDADGAAMWAWYRDGGFDAIAHYLWERDVSAFNPGARPPMTEAKQLMIVQSRSGGEEYLIELIEGRVGEFERGFVMGPFNRLLDRLQGMAPMSSKLWAGLLHHAMMECGWLDLGMVSTPESSSKKRIYAAPEIAERMTKADIRRAAEAPKGNAA